MANMSYCRFGNTLNDLNDCETSLFNGESLSLKEAEKAKRLLELCGKLFEDYTEEDIDALTEKEE